MFLFDWFYGVQASLGLWQKEAQILVLGLDNTAKAFLLGMLKDERLVQHQPTQYPTSEEFSIGKIKFKALVLGVDGIAPRVWRDYLKVDAVVYLVDAYDEDMRVRSWHELYVLLSVEALATVPFLILGMPSFESFLMKPFWLLDKPCAASEDTLEDALGLDLGLATTGKEKVNLDESIVRPLEVFMCSSSDRKMGYRDGLKWLSQYIK